MRQIEAFLDGNHFVFEELKFLVVLMQLHFEEGDCVIGGKLLFFFFLLFLELGYAFAEGCDTLEEISDALIGLKHLVRYIEDVWRLALDLVNKLFQFFLLADEFCTLEESSIEVFLKDGLIFEEGVVEVVGFCTVLEEGLMLLADCFVCRFEFVELEFVVVEDLALLAVDVF